MTVRRRKQQYVEKPVVLPDEADVRKAKHLPNFGPGIALIIPLLLWPAYKDLHKLEITGYRESSNTLLVKRRPESADDIWHCLACEGSPQFLHPAFMQHLRDVHQVEPAEAMGTKQMIMHLDGAGFYQSTFEYTINGMKFHRLQHRKKR